MYKGVSKLTLQSCLMRVVVVLLFLFLLHLKLNEEFFV